MGEGKCANLLLSWIAGFYSASISGVYLAIMVASLSYNRGNP